MLKPGISVVNGFDHHGFTPPILFLDCPKHYLVHFAALLVVSMWIGGIMLVMVLLVLMLHLPLLRLLVVIISTPRTILTLALPGYIYISIKYPIYMVHNISTIHINKQNQT